MGLFRTAVEKDPKHLEMMLNVAGSTGCEVSTRLVLDESAFVSMLYLERRRAERAHKRYVLMLVDVRDALSGLPKIQTSEKLTEALLAITRETDIVGWYVQNSLIGIIGTEIGRASHDEVRKTISLKFEQTFRGVLGKARADLIFVSFHFFPEEERENGDSDRPAQITLYPDLLRKEASRKLALGMKRVIDICGSGLALLLLAPLLSLIALAIKLTSKGPILFRQERLGQYGKRFRLLKFRSMRTNCDSRIHQEYVSRFISGQISEGKDEKVVFKIQKDPRITSIGSFLRRTSLDELPQFWNVLTGAMSLVGPRPPLEYEYNAYAVWHRRRVFEVKPGITGLWQVEGRSRTRFDDMVRLDLKYARQWSIWLDLKILLQTPGAVVSGSGAH